MPRTGTGSPKHNLANQGSCKMLLLFLFIFCFLSSFLLYVKVERGTNEALSKRNLDQY